MPDVRPAAFGQLPQVQPGYLAPLLPDAAPEQGEDWDAIMRDVEDHVMPGAPPHARLRCSMLAGPSRNIRSATRYAQQ